MGMCKVSGGIKKFIGRIGNLPNEDMPANSKAELYDEHENLIQERWYDSEGDAYWNRDWRHSGKGPFPHDHDWDWGRNPPRTKAHLEVNPIFC